MSITQHSVLFRFVSYRFEQQSRYSSATLLNLSKSVRIVTNPFRFVAFRCFSSDMIANPAHSAQFGTNPSRSVAYSFVFGILSISVCYSCKTILSRGGDTHLCYVFVQSFTCQYHSLHSGTSNIIHPDCFMSSVGYSIALRKPNKTLRTEHCRTCSMNGYTILLDKMM
jgi:hypothetical protein